MEVLIVLSIIVSLAVLTARQNFLVSLIISSTVTFVLWVSLRILVAHSLVKWQQSFIPLSLGIAATCFCIIWVLRTVIAQVRERRRIRAAFEQYLAPEMAEMLAKHPERLGLHTEEKLVDFIVLQVADRSGAAMGASFERAFHLILDAGATIENVTQSIVIATFGALPIEKPATSGARQALVQRLIAELGEGIRVVHGSATCLVGNHGPSQRFSFGSLIPNFTAILGGLLALEFGKAKDLG